MCSALFQAPWGYSQMWTSDMDHAYSLKGRCIYAMGDKQGFNKGLAGSGIQRVPEKYLKTPKPEGLKRAQCSEVAPENTVPGTQQVGRVSEGLASGPTHWE